MLLHISKFRPVAVTIMSAGKVLPDSSLIPVEMNLSILSVTTEVCFFLIDLNKSPLGTRHIL